MTDTEPSAISQTENGSIVNLLWTGGWDSTFRLMQVLILEKKEVQPFYVIDEPRKSAGIEIYTMAELKRKIITQYPFAKDLIRPSIFINREHIEPNEKITNAWNKLKENFHLGTQYEWLPRFCNQLNISNMEISLFSAHEAGSESEFRKNYTNYFSQREELGEKIIESDTHRNLHKILENFSAPISNLTKPQMQKIAVENGWMPILKITRFCHNPYTTIEPCGVCKPCNLARNDAMNWRIPVKSKLARKKLHLKILLKAGIQKWFPNFRNSKTG